MTVKFQIASITFFDGTTVDLNANGITVIVGLNNAGKSRLLEEIRQIVELGHNETLQTRKIIEKITFIKQGSDEKYGEFLDQNANIKTDQNRSIMITALGVNTSKNNAFTWWKNDESGLRGITNLHCTLVDTLNRLTTVSPPASINQTPSTPNSASSTPRPP